MADRILVLKGGEIVEQGTHEMLFAEDGLYAELLQLRAGVSVGEVTTGS